MDKKRVAAYCRVSTTSDTQDGSFEVQCEYYEKRIKDDPEHRNKGSYAGGRRNGARQQEEEEEPKLELFARDPSRGQFLDIKY